MHHMRDFIRGIARRAFIAGPRNAFAYTFSRFWTIRRVGRTTQRLIRRTATLPRNEQTLLGNPHGGVVPRAQAIAEHVGARGYTTGLELPEGIVSSIRDFAERTPCTTYSGYANTGRTVRYLYHDWPFAERELGRPVPMGRIRGSSQACPAIAALERDPLLLDAAHAYLDYPPRHIDTRLYWSFARGALGLTDRAALGQNVLYHYDLQHFACHTFFVQFYLSDVEADDGPLVLVPCSHGPKPLGLLWRSAHLSETAVDRHYDLATEEALEGRAGTGFAMDGYLLHRATPPLRRDRLFLQLRIW